MKIELYYTYLKHDIDQWAYRLAEQRIDDPERKGLAEWDGTSSDETFVRRKIEAACAVMRGKLTKKLTVKSEDSKDDILPTNSSWVFEIEGDEKGYVRADYLNELMHMFVVRWVILQWCKLNSINEAASVQSEVDSLLDDITSAVFKLTPPVKRKRTVIGDKSVSIEVE